MWCNRYHNANYECGCAEKRMEKDRGESTLPLIFRILTESNCFFIQAVIVSCLIYDPGPQIHN